MNTLNTLQFNFLINLLNRPVRRLRVAANRTGSDLKKSVRQKSIFDVIKLSFNQFTVYIHRVTLVNFYYQLYKQAVFQAQLGAPADGGC